MKSGSCTKNGMRLNVQLRSGWLPVVQAGYQAYLGVTGQCRPPCPDSSDPRLIVVFVQEPETHQTVHWNILIIHVNLSQIFRGAASGKTKILVSTKLAKPDEANLYGLCFKESRSLSNVDILIACSFWAIFTSCQLISTPIPRVFEGK